MGTSSELIDKAIAEAKSGNKAGAKKILVQVVKNEPSNAQAWYLLSRVVDEKEQIIYCLNKVLEIIPDNSQAKARLRKLQEESTPIPSIQLQTTTPKPPIPVQTTTPEPSIPTHTTKKKSGLDKRIVIVIAGILGFCIILAGVCFGINALGLFTTPTPTIEVSQLIIPTESNANPLEVFTETPVLIPTETVTSNPTVTQFPTETEIPITPIPLPLTLPSDLASCIPSNTTRQGGIVDHIVDGDTIDVRLEDGNTYRVRYIGIDTPEKDRPFYNEATKANSDLVFQKGVILIKDVSDVDQYDRLLRYVIVGDVFVNQELVRLGFAHAVTYPPDVACTDLFILAQQQAIETQSGLWFATPIPLPSAPKVVIVTVNKRDEYVDIKNNGDSDVDLSGWTLVSEKGNQSCNLSGILLVGETLRIWAGNSQSGGFNCGKSSPIWNNSESDPAVLYNPEGIEVSRK